MRHRRRVNTQTIRKKNTSNTGTHFSRVQKKRSKIPMLLFALVLVVAAVYAFKTGYLSFPDSFKKIGQSISRPEKATPKPALPVEQKTTEPLQYYTPIVRKVQLEILNGCGVKGAADKLASFLDAKKYDVINKGNYLKKGKTFFNVKETKVIDQIGVIKNARDLAKAIGVKEINIDSYENPSPIADVTIIIGKDYTSLAIFK